MKLGGFLISSTIAAVGIAATIVILNRRREAWDRQMRNGSRTLRRSVAAETVDGLPNEGEVLGSTSIPSYEDALEEEARLERRLARETGLEI